MVARLRAMVGSITLTALVAASVLLGASSASADAVTSTITLPNGANALNAVVSADSDTIYVSASGGVRVVDAATGTITATIPVGSSPQGLALSPDGTMLVTANAGSANVTVISLVTNSVLGTVAAGAGAFDVAISPDSQFAYVANQVSSPPSVSIIDLTTLTNAGSITGVGSYPTGIALSADGSTLVTGNYLGASASIIDVATRTVLSNVALGTAGSRVAISPDGATAYMINPDASRVSAIDLATRTLSGTVSVGPQPWSVRFAPDGGTVFVAQLNSSYVSVIDVATNTVSSTIPTTKGTRTLAVSPDGSTVYAAHGEEQDSETFEVVSPPFLSVISLTPVIESTVPPAATAGAAYSFLIEATGSPTFEVASGELSPGLTLNTATGEISGIPTGAGTYAFTISANNAGESTTRSFTITVSSAAAGEPGAPELAATGGDTATLALLAAGLLLSGAFAISARPRRSQSA